MYNDGNYIAKCAKMGAYGYLLKNTDESELVLAIRTVSKGKKYFSAEISEKMINFMSTQSISENILSNKETEVLGLLSKGLTTNEIAAKLYVSSRTIETHRGNILKKLEVKNTAELIKKATEMNMI
jgi:DNA-binding NarL/FixJ family response regulator